MFILNANENHNEVPLLPSPNLLKLRIRLGNTDVGKDMEQLKLVANLGKHFRKLFGSIY